MNPLYRFSPLFIHDLQVGDTVLAYNPKTRKMEAEPILHVWKHSDSDLIDLTITIVTPTHNGKPATSTSEVIHTTSEHPFLTTEQGFTPAGQLKDGMHVQRADGSVGVITDWQAVTGTKTMYNLEVNQDHTFVVGDGEWVVHNECNRRLLKNDLGPSTFQSEAHHVAPCELANGTSDVANLMNSAMNGGWKLNGGADNGINLPINDIDGINNGLPTHYATGGHWNYTMQVNDYLQAVIDLAGGVPANNAEAAQMMRVAVRDIRGLIGQFGRDYAADNISCMIDDITL